jgi:hypothetical protein
MYMIGLSAHGHSGIGGNSGPYQKQGVFHAALKLVHNAYPSIRDRIIVSAKGFIYRVEGSGEN